MYNLTKSGMWPTSWQAPAQGLPAAWVSWFDHMCPDLIEKMKATPQDGVHHAEGDVWTHTQMVVETLLVSSEYAQLDPTEQTTVWLAAVFHDMSKPPTTQILPDGRVIAPGHSKRGAIDARTLMWKHEIDFSLREHVCRLIQFHQAPFFAFSDRKGLGGDFLARKLSQECSVKLLCALAKADMKGRICQDQQKTLDDVELFAELAQDLDCFDKPFDFPDGATRSMYVLGHGQRDASTPVYLENPFEVVLLSGLPACGKDTWCAGQNLPVLSYDDTREKLKLKHGEHTGTVVHQVHDQAREYLRKRQSFVWNATHLSQSMRDPALSLIRQYGGRPRIVYLEHTQKQILERNSKRNTSLTNETLLRMTHRWETPMNFEADRVEHVINAPLLSKSLKI